MTKDKFKIIIEKILKFDSFLDSLSNINPNLIEVEELYIYPSVVDMLFKEIFGERGTDIINSWLYEGNKQFVYDLNNKVNISSIEELYDYVINTLTQEHVDW